MRKKLKRDLGQFFTRESVWMQPHIRDHLERLSQQYTVCVDPFAGEGDLLKVASKQTSIKTIGHDHDAKICEEHGWKENDSIREPIAEENAFVLTNPPYLAKNSAKRIGSPMVKYFDSGFVPGIEEGQLKTLDDLYKLAIEKVIQLYDDSIWIVPESVIQDIVKLDEWRDRLHSVTILEENPFEDTEHPVCVLIFSKSSQSLTIYKNDQPLGEWKEIYAFHQKPFEAQGKKIPMKFNSASGQLGFRAVDGTSKEEKGQHIRFLHASELAKTYPPEKIKVSTRHLTYISVEIGDEDLDELIDAANAIIREYRGATQDVFLTAFMGNDKSGKRRRRLDYRLARAIFNYGNMALKKDANALEKKELNLHQMQSPNILDVIEDHHLEGDPFELDNINDILGRIREVNLSEVQQAARSGEKWVKDKIAAYFDRWGETMTMEAKLEQICTEDDEARHFAKDPKKQKFHEKFGQLYLNKNGIEVEDLPQKGKGAIHLHDGKRVCDQIKRPNGGSKSLDCITRPGRLTDYIFQKWVEEPGGTQGNQGDDVDNFLKQATLVGLRAGPTADRYVALVDGPYFDEKKMAEHRSNIPQAEKGRIMVMSTYEYVNMVTSERDGE